MIRDPSDGTIKEITPNANNVNRLELKSAFEEITQKDELKRLELSREWLRQYRQPKQKMEE